MRDRAMPNHQDVGHGSPAGFDGRHWRRRRWYRRQHDGRFGTITAAAQHGGMVVGPPGTDRVPAMLTAGEFVLSKDAVGRLGPTTLAALNAAHKFEMGGFVGPWARGYQQGGLVAGTNACNIAPSARAGGGRSDNGCDHD